MTIISNSMDQKLSKKADALPSQTLLEFVNQIVSSRTNIIFKQEAKLEWIISQ